MATSDGASHITEIIDIELRMFQAVNNEGGPADCQNQPEAFRAMRRMFFGVLSPQVLAACLNDLRSAERAGRNLMTEKYALMCGRIAMPSISPTVQGIVACELDWLQAAVKKHPEFFGGDDADFCLYLLCEMLTYSETTLLTYAQCLADAKREGRNLALERLDMLKNGLHTSPADTSGARRQAPVAQIKTGK
jgi:hypothetical protein